MRTYNHRYFTIYRDAGFNRNEGSAPFTISEVARATTTRGAPYFRPFTVKQPEHSSFEGVRLLDEATIKQDTRPAFEADIGYGPFFGVKGKPVVRMSIDAGDSDSVSDDEIPGLLVSALYRSHYDEWFSLRFTTGGVEWNEWIDGSWRDPCTGVEADVLGGTTLSKVEKWTERYISRDRENKDRIRDMAKTLVSYRCSRELKALRGTAQDKKGYAIFISGLNDRS
jgi:hypothetical protein